ncbi:MAG: PD-(D/E)XK nuclease family protein, partial [Gammaproteobacteria bacterium]|nr:PD-(D/E)XK nuclease family protein [Gammaproteobacteria bacterium]
DGYLRGFIDLTFEHEGRWYVLDYKSNWLGNQAEDYEPERLGRAMRQHRYQLQYLIYLLALHRYLRTRLPDYDYERHIGGAFYLFLRGMDPADGMTRGVWFDRPSEQCIEALDDFMGGGGS